MVSVQKARSGSHLLKTCARGTFVTSRFWIKVVEIRQGRKSTLSIGQSGQGNVERWNIYKLMQMHRKEMKYFFLTGIVF